MLPEHVDQVLPALLPAAKSFNQQIYLWLGARNQNHLVQVEIARKIKKARSPRVFLMIKNQPWEDERHWLGIYQHILGTGLNQKQIIGCHRGFAPSGKRNPQQFRNLPHFDLAMKIKTQTNLPMLLDPSHIGGSVTNVITVLKKAQKFNFDGYLIEAHPRPSQALSDSTQQLNATGLKSALKIIS
ncbi:MAG: hypothetical protein ACD_83C00152G0001 [uncultured bacterium]|nr:MAG: hypothetical protein ACD_83C00152G0001 [uncultured bacterium]